MATVRAVLILATLLFFFLLAVPVQALVARRAPHAAEAIPIFFCRVLLRLLNVRMIVNGPSPQGPVLLAANHVSWIDILCLGAIRPFCFLAKIEVSRWPLLATFARVQGTVFVDRGRRRSIIPANRDLAARMSAGRPVLIFPEGTTCRPPIVARFRSSHFAAARELLRRSDGIDAVAVQPVAIGYSSPQAAWVDDAALLPHIWEVLRQPPLVCSIGFGTPIAYVRDSDRKVVAGQAQASVVALLTQYGRAEALSAPPVVNTTDFFSVRQV